MPAEKLCKNCISWTRCINGKYDPVDKSHQGDCISNAFLYSDNNCVAPTNGLVYWDAESYAAGFQTGENFGCVHFNPNPPKPCNPRYICTIRNISYSCTMDSCVLSKPMCTYCDYVIKGE